MKRRTQIARFVSDAALIPSSAARDEDADDDAEGDTPTGGPERSSDEGDDDSDSDADDSDEDDPETIGNPAAKRHAEDAKKQRIRAREANERADELQRQLDAAPGVTAITEARQETDFYRFAVTELNDIDAAWKLADHSLLSTDDNGVTIGVDKVIKKLKTDYPHLADDPSTDDTRKRTTQVPAAPGSGGSPSNPRRGGSGNTSTPRQTLNSKFPALARTRPR